MQEDRDTDLDRLIAAVANGESVDWKTEQARRPDLVPLFEELHVAEAVAAYHRGIHEQSVSSLGKWGSLELREKVGEGGAAEIFRAFDPRLQTDVALKLIRPGPGTDGRILEEGRRMARVRHPNVLVVYGADRHEQRAGIWTDLIQGRTLEDLLLANGPFGAAEAATIGLDLSRALAAVHAAGLVHRDVKTTNVMRERGGRVVLLDFGAGAEHRPGESGELVEDGTPLTMAPEQLRGEPTTPASDLYSLGVLLYRLVTGRFPYEASTYAELQALHDASRRTPLRDLRPDLGVTFVQAVERALESRPSDRFASAGEFERALLAVGKEDRSKSQPQARPLAGFLPTIAILLAIVAASWFGYERMRVDRPDLARDAPDEAKPGLTVEGISAAKPALGLLAASAALLVERDGREQALAPGDRVEPGDGLALKFRAEEPAHVYVLDEDARGEVFVLFPTAGLEPANPLPPGKLHRLPGTRAGQALSWQVTSAGGSETVIVIATREPFAALEKEIAGFPRASLDRPVAYGKVSEGTLATLRGIGGMMESEVAAGSPPANRLADAVRRLSSLPNAGAPWTWQIELQNPNH